MKRSECKPGAPVRITAGSCFNTHLVGKTGRIHRLDAPGVAWPVVVAVDDHEGFFPGGLSDFEPDELELIRPGDDFDERPNWSIARAGVIMAGAFLALLALLRRR